MQDAVNTVIHDTVHTMSFDTIHTVAYDTVHTTVFDTVRVVLDSSFTPQLLRDSQAFYSSAFGWLLGVFSIAAAVLVAFYGIKFFFDKKGVYDKVRQISKNTVEESRKDIDKAIFDIRDRNIAHWLTQAKIDEQRGGHFAVMCFDFALSDVCEYFDKTFVQYGRTAIEGLTRNIHVLKCLKNNEKVVNSLFEKVQHFEGLLLTIKYDKNEKNASDEKEFVKVALAEVSAFIELLRQNFNCNQSKN